MAGAQLGTFKQIAPLAGVYAATKATLRCTAVILKDKTVCLFSPVTGLSEEAAASLAKIGRVTFLVAPNHYHNKALREYAEAFPQAKLCASKDAQPRLNKVTSLKFDDLQQLEKALPKSVTIVETQGLKTGEIWLRIKLPKFRAWFVVDAFGGAKITGEACSTSTPSMLGTFPKMGVADAAKYKTWVLDQIATDKPDLIVPCHGAIFRSRDLTKRLAALVEQRF